MDKKLCIGIPKHEKEHVAGNWFSFVGPKLEETLLNVMKPMANPNKAPFELVDIMIQLIHKFGSRHSYPITSTDFPSTLRPPRSASPSTAFSSG